MKDGKVVSYIDGKDESIANWLRFVNCARIEPEQNLVAFQFDGEIYYHVYKKIYPGDELLVWYGDEYAQELGIDLESDEEASVEGIPCKYCHRHFTGNLELHMRSCLERPKDWKCNECNKAFVTSVLLKRHQQWTHKEKSTLVCRICGQMMSTKTNLWRHSFVHTGKKPFSCEKCGKQFARKDALLVHQRRHIGYKMYKCDMCWRSFASAETFQAHKRVVHNKESAYRCHICGMIMAWKRSLERHYMIHTGEKPFSCKICGKPFRRSYHLNQHLNLHKRKVKNEGMLEIGAVT